MAARSGTRPAVESLEGRLMLTGSSSPTDVIPVSPPPIGTETPAQLAAAYRQVVAIETDTLSALGDAYRRVESAAAPIAARANHAVAHDRRIAQVAAAIATQAEQGLDISRGLEDYAASTYKFYIPNRIFSTLGEITSEAQTLSTELIRSARRSTDAAVHKLDALDEKLAG